MIKITQTGDVLFRGIFYSLIINSEASMLLIYRS